MSEFSMFYKKFGCMHACILHVFCVRLTRGFCSIKDPTQSSPQYGQKSPAKDATNQKPASM